MTDAAAPSSFAVVRRANVLITRITRITRIVRIALMTLISWSTVVAAQPADKPATTPESISFADFYKRPIGPRGLEPGTRLLALAGTRIALIGFVAHGGETQPGLAILAPAPVLLDDEDESLADDLPAAVAYIHFTDAAFAAALAACRHVVRVTGKLELGRAAEADGRMSFVRIQTDDIACVR